MTPHPPRSNASIDRINSSQDRTLVKWNATEDVLAGIASMLYIEKVENAGNAEQTQRRDNILWQTGLAMVIVGFAGALMLMMLGLYRFARSVLF